MKLPDGWKEVKLGDYIALKNGLNFSQDFNGVEINFLGVGNFKNNKKIRNESELDKIYLAQIPDNDYLLRKDDLVFVRSNGSKELVGRCVIIDNSFDKTTYSGFCIRGRLISREVTSYYIATLIEAGFLRRKLKKENRGTNISNLNQEILSDLTIPLPPLPEQKAIAETLSLWDNMIEKTERLIENEIKKYKWLVYKLIQQPSDRNVWQKIKLEQILKEGSKTPVTDTSHYKKITIKLHKKGIEFADLLRNMADTRPFYIRHSGELIIGKQNYFNGSVALVRDKFDGCICSNAIMSFSISDKVNSRFLYEAVSYDKYLKRREALANGTGQKELTEKDFLNFEVFLPPLTEQTKIADTLDLAQHEIDLLRQLTDQYKIQKQGLMQKLLTGQWRIG